MNPDVDPYFYDGCGRCKYAATSQCKVRKWPMELEKLRIILHESGLKEELKWGIPCYTFRNKNLLTLCAFKEYCALNFFKGALLKDVNQLLVKPGENTQAGRQMRFNDVNQIIEIEDIIKTYIHETIEIEKEGVKFEPKELSEYSIPDEFLTKLNSSEELKSAFESLTPGRQKAYLFYFSAPKQSKTREDRIEKYIQKILDGKGITD